MALKDLAAWSTKKSEKTPSSACGSACGASDEKKAYAASIAIFFQRIIVSASCIISRAEQTFIDDYGKKLLKDWNIPDTYIARCFVILGYIDGEQPQAKPRIDGRIRIID